MTSKHSVGAIKAAEIIMQHPYDHTGEDQTRFDTSIGSKTVMGVASIIDRSTNAPELLRMLKLMVVDPNVNNVLKSLQAISKAEGWQDVIKEDMIW